MAQQQFPLPPLQPLTRLNVQDSLRIDAARWSIAHDYHRQRQTLHYQALWEPGIICGLGVRVIDPPPTARSQFRDQRWIEIQPGIAMDVAGNPIVVGAEPAENRTYRLATPAPVKEPLTVHVVLGHVDPDTLELPEQVVHISEQFRLDERVKTLDARDIELCRLQFWPGEVRLQSPKDPFAPGPYELDLRSRRVAQIRPQACLRIGALDSLSHQTVQHWQGLLDSLPMLCPTLRGVLDLQPLEAIAPQQLANYDLLYVTPTALAKWQTEGRDREWAALRHYLNMGGTVLLEATHRDPSLKPLVYRLTENTGVSGVNSQHQLKRHPFRFGQLPPTANGKLELFYGMGVVLAIAPLSEAWDSELLPRHDIRSAHELGINLLHFAWQRHHYHQLLT
jgi:hypothetical protein